MILGLVSFFAASDPASLNPVLALNEKWITFPNVLNWIPSDALFKTKGGRCIYCGERASVIEHLVPLCFLESRKRKTSDRFLRSESCHDCNQLLGSRFFETLDDRISWVNERLRGTNGKIKVPQWTAEELSEMGYAIRSHISKQQQIKLLATRRACWVNTPEYVNLREDLARQCEDQYPENHDLLNFMAPGWSRHHL